MKKKSNYLQIDEIGKRFLTVDEVLIPVPFSWEVSSNQKYC
jgi:hypothetical protein